MFTVGETIERMKPDGTNVSLKVIGIFDEDGNAQESAPHRLPEPTGEGSSRPHC